ncbi:MAG: hypothetical protein DMF64_12940 [Acidobacteria bacterium]|nr:MAG: hypothetical protein DMF64_12940 [Acidobacteriota bacterium]
MSNPKTAQSKLDRIISAWETLAPDKSFGGMTLAQFKAAVQPSYDKRAELTVLENQVQSKQVERETADTESLRLVQLVVNGVVGDPTEGPDGDLYEAMGYVRASQRHTGLTRKKKAGTKNGNKQ